MATKIYQYTELQTVTFVLVASYLKIILQPKLNPVKKDIAFSASIIVFFIIWVSNLHFFAHKIAKV